MTTIYQSSISNQQLNRRYLNVIAFAYRFASATVALHRCVVSTLNARAVSGFTGSQCSGRIVSDSSRLAKTERPQEVDQPLSSQALPQRSEIVIARIRDGLGGSEGRQMIRVHTGQRKVQTVESSGTDYAGILIDQSGSQRRQRGKWLH